MSFQSPGGIKSEKSSSLGVKFYLDPKSLNIIIIRGAFDGLPKINEVEFQGKKICKGNKVKVKLRVTEIDKFNP